jgi:hypothetical protein
MRKDFTMEELNNAVFEMAVNKVADLDGFNVEFIKKLGSS